MKKRYWKRQLLVAQEEIDRLDGEINFWAELFVGTLDSRFTAEDGGKMLVLADWLDRLDDKKNYTGPREVQADLRRWADLIAQDLDRAGASPREDEGGDGSTDATSATAVTTPARSKYVEVRVPRDGGPDVIYQVNRSTRSHSVWCHEPGCEICA